LAAHAESQKGKGVAPRITHSLRTEKAKKKRETEEEEKNEEEGKECGEEEGHGRYKS